MRKKVNVRGQYHEAYLMRVKSFIADIKAVGQMNIYNKLIENGFVTHASYPCKTFYSDVRNAEVSGTGVLIKPEILSAVFSVMGMSSDAVFGKSLIKAPIQFDKDSVATLYSIIAKLQKETVKDQKDIHEDVLWHGYHVVSIISQFYDWDRWHCAIFDLFTNYSSYYPQYYKHSTNKMAKIDFILERLLSTLPVGLDRKNIHGSAIFFSETTVIPDFKTLYWYSALLALCYQLCTLFNIMDLFFMRKQFRYMQKRIPKVNFKGFEFKRTYSIECTAEQKRKLQAHIESFKKIYEGFFTENKLPNLIDNEIPSLNSIVLTLQEILLFFLGITSITRTETKTDLPLLRNFLGKSEKISSECKLVLSDAILDKFDLLQKLLADSKGFYEPQKLPVQNKTETSKEAFRSLASMLDENEEIKVIIID